MKNIYGEALISIVMIYHLTSINVGVPSFIIFLDLSALICLL
ncbi:MAG: hypothetical protein WCG25_02400 [bacterium]